MLLRRRLAARRKFDEKDRNPVAASLKMHKSAFAAVAEARPGLCFRRKQVNAKILVDGNTFPLRPIEVGIEQESRFCRRHDAASRICSSSKYFPIREGTPDPASSRSQIAW